MFYLYKVFNVDLHNNYCDSAMIYGHDMFWWTTFGWHNNQSMNKEIKRSLEASDMCKSLMTVS